MAQKKTASQSAAKMASKNARMASAASSTARESAEKVVRIGNDAMKDFFASSADEAQKAQEKMFSIGRESAENFAKSSDMITKMAYEAVAGTRDSVESCIESSNVVAAMAKDVSSEVFESANQMFSENLEMTKEFFACRTINDMMELSNRMMRQNCENMFNQTSRMSSMMIEYASEAMEPINERVSRATQQFTKAVNS